MNRMLHIVVALMVVCLVVCGAPQHLLAQWEIVQRPRADWGVVQALAEVSLNQTLDFSNHSSQHLQPLSSQQSGSPAIARAIVVGTSEGVFLSLQTADPAAMQLRNADWQDISAGLPTTARDIRSIVAIDSTIFVLSARGGVYFLALTASHLQARSASLPWKPLMAGLPSLSPPDSADESAEGLQFTVLLVHPNGANSAERVLLLGTNAGVWRMRWSPGSAFKHLRWHLVGDMPEPVSAMTIRATPSQSSSKASIYAAFGGNHLRGEQIGVMTYPLDCDDCGWRNISSEASSQAVFKESTLQALSVIEQDPNSPAPLSLYNPYNAFEMLPCSGMLVATKGAVSNAASRTSVFGSDNSVRRSAKRLLLGTRINPENPMLEWIDISPSRYNASFNSGINTLLVGGLPSMPNAIIVGTESRGILFSNDCGMTWYECNEGISASSSLGDAGVKTFHTSNGEVLAAVKREGGFVAGAEEAGTRSPNPTTAKSSSTDGRVATLSLQDFVRAAAIADASSRAADSVRSRDARLSVITDVAIERGIVHVTMTESQPIEIIAYNLLGKKVMDIYSGDAKTGVNTVPFDLTMLSRGVYICVVRSRSFKMAEKFLVTR
jgi:hypothetical protein